MRNPSDSPWSGPYDSQAGGPHGPGRQGERKRPSILRPEDRANPPGQSHQREQPQQAREDHQAVVLRTGAEETVHHQANHATDAHQQQRSAIGKFGGRTRTHPGPHEPRTERSTYHATDDETQQDHDAHGEALPPVLSDTRRTC